MTSFAGSQSFVSSLVLLSCLADVLHVHMDAHVGVTLLAHILMKKRSLEHSFFIKCGCVLYD